MMFKLYKRYKEAKQATPEENDAAIEAAKARILAASENVSPEPRRFKRRESARYARAAYPIRCVAGVSELRWILESNL